MIVCLFNLLYLHDLALPRRSVGIPLVVLDDGLLEPIGKVSLVLFVGEVVVHVEALLSFEPPRIVLPLDHADRNRAGQVGQEVLQDAQHWSLGSCVGIYLLYLPPFLLQQSLVAPHQLSPLSANQLPVSLEEELLALLQLARTDS